MPSEGLPYECCCGCCGCSLLKRRGQFMEAWPSLHHARGRTPHEGQHKLEVLLAQKLDLAFYFLLDKLFHLPSSKDDSSGNSSSNKENESNPNSDLLRLRHCRPDNRKRGLIGWNGDCELLCPSLSAASICLHLTRALYPKASHGM